MNNIKHDSRGATRERLSRGPYIVWVEDSVTPYPSIVCQLHIPLWWMAATRFPRLRLIVLVMKWGANLIGIASPKSKGEGEGEGARAGAGTRGGAQ